MRFSWRKQGLTSPRGKGEEKGAATIRNSEMRGKLKKRVRNLNSEELK